MGKPVEDAQPMAEEPREEEEEEALPVEEEAALVYSLRGAGSCRAYAGAGAACGRAAFGQAQA